MIPSVITEAPIGNPLPGCKSGIPKAYKHPSNLAAACNCFIESSSTKVSLAIIFTSPLDFYYI